MPGFAAHNPAALHLLKVDQAITNALVTRVLGVALIATALALMFRQQLFDTAITGVSEG